MNSSSATEELGHLGLTLPLFVLLWFGFQYVHICSVGKSCSQAEHKLKFSASLFLHSAIPATDCKDKEEEEKIKIKKIKTVTCPGAPRSEAGNNFGNNYFSYQESDGHDQDKHSNSPLI